MKIITFNCWHGLSKPGLLELHELESRADRASREARQVQQIAQAQADLYFFQEVNPLLPRLSEMLKQLSGNYVGLAQHDLTGLKVLGLGFPTNLNAGLGIIAQSEFSPRKLSGPKLSGDHGFNSSIFSVQFTESRYALLAEAQIFGEPTLLVNCHLHHGYPLNPDIEKELDRLQAAGLLLEDQRVEIMQVLKYSGARRLQEYNVLQNSINEVRAPYKHIIVAGDFNTEPEDSALKDFLKAVDLVDVVAAKGLKLSTFTAEKNPEIFQASGEFDLGLPEFERPELHELWHSQNNRARRLDYVLLSPDLFSRVKNVELWGAFTPSSLNTSDHFGLKIEI